MQLVMRMFSLAHMRWQERSQQLGLEIESLALELHARDLGLELGDSLLIRIVAAHSIASTQLGFGAREVLLESRLLLVQQGLVRCNVRETHLTRDTSLFESRHRIVRGREGLESQCELSSLLELCRPTEDHRWIADMLNAVTESLLKLH